jgi:hypothetical protein
MAFLNEFKHGYYVIATNHIIFLYCRGGVFGMVVDNLASMLEDALKEKIPRSRSNDK